MTGQPTAKISREKVNHAVLEELFVRDVM